MGNIFLVITLNLMWMGVLRGQNGPKGVNRAHEMVSRLVPCPGTGLPLLPNFDLKMSHFWPPQVMDIWPGWSKMVPYHHPICLTSLWVQPIPKVSITVVATAIRVTKKAEKSRKMAKIRLFLSHRGWYMAPKLFSHQYLLVPMIWCDF